VIAPARGPGLRARSLNRLVLVAVGRLGLPVPGTWILHTLGRRSGRWRATPVCVARVGGGCYLVAPRGETGWARNLRAAPECELRRGGRRVRLRATEVTDEERAVVVAAYLRRYGWLTGRFFDLPRRRPTSADVAREAPRHPTFRLHSRV
jgi:deazaflavin-dependent oxidoreductase (nitroreductase family)